MFPPNPVSTLYSMILETFPGTPLVPLDRKYWSEKIGLDYLQTLAFRDDVEAIKVAIEGNFYATCALSAVCYVQSVRNWANTYIVSGYEIPRLGVLHPIRASFFEDQVPVPRRHHDD
jgi:hypothetical protein